MLRFVIAGLLALAIPVCFVSAADDVKAPVLKGDGPSLKFVPPEGPIKTSTLVVFKIETNGKQVLIEVNSPYAEFRKDSSGKEVVFLFRAAGEYKISGYTSLDDNLIKTEFVVTVVRREDEPGPGPGPGPIPVDPLVKELQDAYNADSAVDKRERMAGLVRAMKYGADQATIKATNGDVVSVVSQKTKDEIGDNLIGIRKAIGKYLNANLPLENQQMTPELRKKYVDAYNKIADSLEKISK